jgi:hypothetical protein
MARHVSKFRLEKIEVSCEYIDRVVNVIQNFVVLHLGGWELSKQLVTIKYKLITKGPGFGRIFGKMA